MHNEKIKVRVTQTGQTMDGGGFNKRADGIEIYISQGAKPGLGGQLMAKKVTKELARVRGIPEGIDLRSPSRHPDIMGADDLVIAAPTPADVVATGGGASGLWVALSEKRNWVRRRIQDPVLGAPQLVGTSTASLDQIELTIWDRDADGRDEIALFASTADGRLELSLLAAPRSGGAPSLSVWWSSDALLGTYAEGSVSATVQPLGPLRDPADGKRALRSELIVEANLGGERRTLAISGAAPNSATAR